MPFLETAFALYLGFVAFLYAFQRRLVFVPDRSPPLLGPLAALGVREARIATRDGLSLLSWYLPARPGAATIAYFHGNGGHIGDRALRLQRFAREGFGALFLEYRGYGGNPGRPSEDGFLKDGRAALEFLEGERVAEESLVFYGESLGTALAVRLAVERRPAAVVLEAPFTRLAAVARSRFPYVPASLLLRDRFETLSRIAELRAPLLVLHGERDRGVPARLGRALFAVAPEPKESWFPVEGGHCDLAEFGALDAVFRFLRRRLGDKVGRAANLDWAN